MTGLDLGQTSIMFTYCHALKVFFIICVFLDTLQLLAKLRAWYVQFIFIIMIKITISDNKTIEVISDIDVW